MALQMTLQGSSIASQCRLHLKGHLRKEDLQCCKHDDPGRQAKGAAGLCAGKVPDGVHALASCDTVHTAQPTLQSKGHQFHR